MASRSLTWVFASAAGIAVADQAIKRAIGAIQPDVNIIPGFFAIRLAINPGAAFSLFQEFPMLLTLIGVAAVAGFTVHVYRGRALSTTAERGGWTLVLGGAAGNVIDRLRLGYVVDYLDLYVGDYHWPTFNLADSAISVGVVWLLFLGLRPRGARTARRHLPMRDV